MTNIVHKFILAASLAAIAGGLSLSASAQGTPAPPPPGKTDKPKFKGFPHAPSGWERSGSYEKAIAVAPNVNFTLCVTEGNLRVNGWNRSEVRVYVEDGPKFSFKVIDTGANGSPVWISAVNAEPKPGNNSECIRGETVEIDAPVGATLNLTGRAISAQIDGLRKVGVKTVGGDISIRNTREGVTANTYEGDITVEESWGQVALESTTGNIVVVDSGPSDIGDTFRAKTNSGAISLTHVTHRAVDVNSISGSVLFNGELKNGGTYAMSTTNGTIKIALPALTGCKLAATFTAGSFTSEFPFKIETENIAPGDLKTIVAKIGTGGEALLKLSTIAGLIGIKRQ